MLIRFTCGEVKDAVRCSHLVFWKEGKIKYWIQELYYVDFLKKLDQMKLRGGGVYIGKGWGSAITYENSKTLQPENMQTAQLSQT